MKILKFALLITSLTVLTTFSACKLSCVKGSGNVVSETRKLTDFTSIEVSGDYKVTLKQDSSLSITINADDNVMKHMITDVSGGQLKIHSKKNICAKKQMEIVVGVRNLEALKGSGAVELISDGKLKVKDLDLHFTGACKANLDLSADHVTTEGSGATELYLKGQAVSHAAKLTGGSKVEALDFVVGKYDLETTGAADCKINVLTELNVQCTGAADIQYRGNPTSVNTNKTGAASVKKIN